jgi:hypothetical protein
VPAPIIFAHIAEGGGNAALRGDGVGTGGKNLGDASGAQAGFAAADHRAQSGATGADHHHIVGVILDRISAAVNGRCGAAVLSSLGHAHNPNDSFNMP